ncbi:MAG: Gfo/Idh/MocA family oxidoreductase [Gammaproteobacteria bacterium]|nr:Gfo/Idh/MocA family oxidoreductase [Gammaproteobacteria bacterium]MYC53885.1 Gfo/Idh/MocA family oxidoreductase [Gammaproteobacteria bacterium]
MSPAGTENVRVLLVGAGVRGAKWARVIAEAPDATLAGIVDLDEARARRARDERAPDAPVERDFASALTRIGADAVVIATPPDSHHSLVRQAFDRGLDVLCEKPLSDDMDEVLDLIARADDAGRHLLIGMNFRYLPTSQRIRHYALSGDLGALSYGHFTYHRQRDGNRHDLNDYVMTMAHPMLLEQSIHHFDLLRYCYDAEVESLVCDTWRPSWSTYEDDCCVSVLFCFENGVRANYLGTWTAAWNRMDFRWRTEFEDGALIQHEQFEDLVRVDFDRGLGLRGSNFKGDAEAEIPVPEPLAPCTAFIDDTRELLAEFLRAVRDEAEPVTTARDHLKTLLVVQACIESAQRRGWVALREMEERFRVSAPPVNTNTGEGRSDADAGSARRQIAENVGRSDEETGFPS